MGEVAAEQVAAAVGGQIVSPASEGGASPRDSVAGGSPLASPRAEVGWCGAGICEVRRFV